ncbi:dihydrofolate reductase [Rhabdobacter roseus]|uniref:Dihydrofolate reductase n=2 Tax=Rhabdobacter roseus TaxID=1655419 RepID=A0A840TXI9_9BACT|nr:dihydrofolate reductase [Rhabdobacter roseus]
MHISLLVAVAENGVIGRDNQLIWRLPDDLKQFKRLTLGHPMIMGRKTYESIGKPLPGRTSIVITRDIHYAAQDVEVVHSLEEALEAARRSGTDEVFVIGGGEVYRQALPLADRLYLTEVHGAFEGDTFFTIPDENQWAETFQEHHPADERHTNSFDFRYLERKPVV